MGIILNNTKNIDQYIILAILLLIALFLIISIFNNKRYIKMILILEIILLPGLIINIGTLIFNNKEEHVINIKNQINENNVYNIYSNEISYVESAPSKNNLNIPSGSSLNKYTTSTNKTINYYQIVSNNPTYDMPLIVYLHGDGETYNLNSIPKLPIYNFILNEYLDNSFIFIAPHRSKRDWVSNTVTINLKELIDNIVNNYHIDKNKIIIMGASRGSMGVWNMVSLYGDYFSAACPISWHPTTNLNYNNLVKVPFYAISGNTKYPENEVNKKMTETINRINELGGNALIKTYDGQTHDTIAAAFPNKELLNWLLNA